MHTNSKSFVPTNANKLVEMAPVLSVLVVVVVIVVYFCCCCEAGVLCCLLSSLLCNTAAVRTRARAAG